MDTDKIKITIFCVVLVTIYALLMHGLAFRGNRLIETRDYKNPLIEDKEIVYEDFDKSISTIKDGNTEYHIEDIGNSIYGFDFNLVQNKQYHLIYNNSSIFHKGGIRAYPDDNNVYHLLKYEGGKLKQDSSKLSTINFSWEKGNIVRLDFNKDHYSVIEYYDTLAGKYQGEFPSFKFVKGKMGTDSKNLIKSYIEYKDNEIIKHCIYSYDFEFNRVREAHVKGLVGVASYNSVIHYPGLKEVFLEDIGIVKNVCLDIYHYLVYLKNKYPYICLYVLIIIILGILYKVVDISENIYIENFKDTIYFVICKRIIFTNIFIILFCVVACGFHAAIKGNVIIERHYFQDDTITHTKEINYDKDRLTSIITDSCTNTILKEQEINDEYILDNSKINEGKYYLNQGVIKSYHYDNIHHMYEYADNKLSKYYPDCLNEDLKSESLFYDIRWEDGNIKYIVFGRNHYACIEYYDSLNLYQVQYPKLVIVDGLMGVRPMNLAKSYTEYEDGNIVHQLNFLYDIDNDKVRKIHVTDSNGNENYTTSISYPGVEETIYYDIKFVKEKICIGLSWLWNVLKQIYELACEYLYITIIIFVLSFLIAFTCYIEKKKRRRKREEEQEKLRLERIRKQQELEKAETIKKTYSFGYYYLLESKLITNSAKEIIFNEHKIIEICKVKNEAEKIKNEYRAGFN